MGSIGHDDLLHHLRRWQIRAAIRGYYRQQRPHYEAARMLGLWTVSCQRSKNSPPLKIHDLIKFPWEQERPADLPTDEEVEELRRMIDEENRQIEAAKKAPQQ